MIKNLENSTNKSSNWFLTINNPTTDDENVIERLGKNELLQSVRYAKWAIENGEANGVRHMHIYLNLSCQQRFSAIKKMWPKAHIEEPQGTPKQNIDYIGNPDFTYSDKNPNPDKRGKKKGGTCESQSEYGTVEGIKLNQKAGSTSNIDNRLLACKTLIDEGKQLHELWEADFTLMVKYGNKIADYMVVRGMIESRNARDLARTEQEATERKEKKAVLREVEALFDAPLTELPF
jgi:hypothetical protein